MKNFSIIFLCFFLLCCQQKPNGEIATDKRLDGINRVFFKNIQGGDTLESPFSIQMGVLGMQVKPAGELQVGTGHHHILINREFMDYGEIIPMDKNHLHYGKGDSIVSISLPSGDHKLTLQFANGLHMSYGKQYSNTVSIYVK